MCAYKMFRSEGVSLPPFQQEAMIIVSSLSPQKSHPLSFEDMHKMKYRELKSDLKKVLSPKKPDLTPTQMTVRTYERKRQMEKTIMPEPTLYQPSTRDFSLSPNRKTISPSELVLLRDQHSKKANQVELNATSVSSLRR
jgi:hypothetical protein